MVQSGDVTVGGSQGPARVWEMRLARGGPVVGVLLGYAVTEGSTVWGWIAVAATAAYFGVYLWLHEVAKRSARAADSIDGGRREPKRWRLVAMWVVVAALFAFGLAPLVH